MVIWQLSSFTGGRRHQVSLHVLFQAQGSVSLSWIASSHEKIQRPWRDLNLQQWGASNSRSTTLTTRQQISFSCFEILKYYFFYFSVAILRYLTSKYNLPEHWYPRNDLQRQARIEEYLHWQHLNTRMQAAMVFQQKVSYFSQFSQIIIIYPTTIFFLGGTEEVLESLCWINPLSDYPSP